MLVISCDACYVSTGIRLQRAFKSPSMASLHLICSGKYCLSWQQKQAPYLAKGDQRSPIFWRSSLMTLHASQALPLWWFIHNKWLAWWRVRTLWANMPTGLSFIHQVSNGLWLQRLWSNWPNGPASSLAWKNARHREDSWNPDGSRDSRVMCCLPRWELKSSVLRSPVPAGQLAVQPKWKNPSLPCWDSPWDPSQMSRSLCTIRIHYISIQKKAIGRFVNLFSKLVDPL